MKEKALKPATVVMLLLLTLIWGLTLPVAKYALQAFPPLLLGGLRFLLAGGIFLAISLKRWHEIRSQSRVDRKILLAYTLMLVIQIIFLFFGVENTSANRSTILFNTSPFWVLFLAIFFLPGERLTPFKWVGTSLAFVGLLVLFAGRRPAEAGGTLFGDLLVLAAAFTWGIRIVLLKHFQPGTSVVTIQLWQFLLGGAILTGLGFGVESVNDIHLSPGIVAAFLFLAVVSNAIAFALWTYLVTQGAATRMAPFLFLSPVFGVLASAVLLGEPVSTPLVISLVSVGCGIFVVNYSGRFGLPKHP